MAILEGGVALGGTPAADKPGLLLGYEPWRGFTVVLQEREERRLWEARLEGLAETERRGCD
jgi:hypothetical protein